MKEKLENHWTHCYVESRQVKEKACRMFSKPNGNVLFDQWTNTKNHFTTVLLIMVKVKIIVVQAIDDFLTFNPNMVCL